MREKNAEFPRTTQNRSLKSSKNHHHGITQTELCSPLNNVQMKGMAKTHKAIIGLGILSLSGLGAVWAKDGALEEKKQKVITQIDEQLNRLQGHKSCVTSAETSEALTQCKISAVEQHREEKAERKEKIKAKLGEKIKHLQEKKKMLDQLTDVKPKTE